MFFDLPSGAKLDKYIIGMPTTEWHTWTNPRKEYNNAIILAAGGGGSGGVNAFGGSSGNGGGGGGGFGHIYCPLSLLPDTLYIQVALGALGVIGTVGGTGGNTGGTTYISMYPSPNIANLLIACNGGGGGGGASSAIGAGGTVNIYNTFGIAQGYTGGSGGSWNIGYSSVGGSCLPTTGSPIYGGSGAAYIGGGNMLSASSLYPTFTWQQGNRNGSVLQKPFTVFGGYGANTCCSGGFNGIMGAGGGGGGESSQISGKGGDGFVTIICY